MKKKSISKIKNEIEIDNSNFEKEVIERSKKVPVVVDFWASWCGPCNVLGPVLERLAREYKGEFVLAKLNVEDSPGKAEEYKVMSIPSVKLFKNGKIVDEFLGAIPEISIKNW